MARFADAGVKALSILALAQMQSGGGVSAGLGMKV